MNDITERKYAERELKNSKLELRNFVSQLQNVREDEKKGLAREIHDDLGQYLLALKMYLEGYKMSLLKKNNNFSSEEILKNYNFLSEMVDQSIKISRSIMTGLRPEIIELLGFAEASKSILHEFEEKHHIPCQFLSTVGDVKINQQKSVALFRIVQEALSNIIKYAQATSVKIQLSNNAGILTMEIIDNGIGFDQKLKKRQDAYGLNGMRERVTLLEGNLSIDSKVGKGTSLKVTIPNVSQVSRSI